MHWEAIVHKSVPTWSVKPPSIARGIGAFLAALPAKKAAAWAAGLRTIDWDADIAPCAKWIDRVLAKFPLPDDVAGLWFYVPEIELNAPFTYFIGSRSFHTKDGQWACADHWNLSELAEKAKAASFPVEFVPKVLEQVQRVCNVGPGDAAERDVPQAPIDIYAGVSLTYCGLLVRHALDRVSRRALLGGREFRGIGFGFASGDTQGLGVVTASGWEAPSRKRIVEFTETRPKASDNPKLDINSWDFDIRAYLKAGLDVHASDEDGGSLLMHGTVDAIDPHYPSIRRLLELGVDARSPGVSRATPLLMLAQAPADIVAALLKRGADPNARNDIGRAPIHSAVGHECRLANVKLMLEHGADPNLKDMAGRQPLHHIAENGDPTYSGAAPSEKIIGLLIDHGAKVEGLDQAGSSPLLHAVGRFAAYETSETPGERSQFARVIIALLKQGADANRTYKVSPDPRIPVGGTPLMCQRYDDGEVHLALLKHGADPRAVCKKGRTALDYARQRLSKAKPNQRAGIQVVIEALEAAMGGRAAPETLPRKRGVKKDAKRRK